MNEENIYTERLSDFIEAASHDLNAPLRKLSVLVDRLFSKHKNEFTEGAQDYITRIENCVSEMKSLVDGLTELARADSHVNTFTSCDLNLIVTDAITMMQEEIAEKNVEVDVSGSLPTIQGNEILLRELFKNLIENAIKFNDSSSPKVSIRSSVLQESEKLSTVLPAKRFFKIDVCDNGIGFDNAYAEKIFEPFVRLHAKSQYDGSGLGLSISKKIVKNHDGSIYAEANEKEGSRFVLILPETPTHTC